MCSTSYVPFRNESLKFSLMFQKSNWKFEKYCFVIRLFKIVHWSGFFGFNFDMNECDELISRNRNQLKIQINICLSFLIGFDYPLGLKYDRLTLHTATKSSISASKSVYITANETIISVTKWDTWTISSL